MKCKSCGKSIPDRSKYCNHCGASQSDLTIPEPKQLSDGRYRGQIMRDGSRKLIYGNSREEYRLNAERYKLFGTYDEPEQSDDDADDVDVVTLNDLIYDYIESHDKVLASTSKDTYHALRRNLNVDLLGCDIEVIDYQVLVDMIGKTRSAASVRNFWTLIKSSLNYAGYPTPVVRLPYVGKSEQSALSPDEVQKLLDYVYNKPIELPIILGLHSLRAGEVMALEREDIYNDLIHVTKNRIHDDTTNSFFVVPWTKTSKSHRNIRIFIPRLYEILPEKFTLRKDFSQTNLSAMVKRACAAAGITPITFHGLRRTFASICYNLGISEHATMEMGGWGSISTIHNYYIKLDNESRNKDNQKLLDYYAFTTKSEKASDNGNNI